MAFSVDLQWRRDRLTMIGMVLGVATIGFFPLFFGVILCAALGNRRGEPHWIWVIYVGVVGLLLGFVVDASTGSMV